MVCMMIETIPPPTPLPPSQPFPPPRPECLHPLLKDVPYWRQVIPSTVSVEAWVQGSYINGFLHPSFKLFGFSCEYFSVLTSFHHHAELSPMKMARREIEEAGNGVQHAGPNFTQSVAGQNTVTHLDKLIKGHFRLTV